jgi:hypothetical protein
MRSFWVVVVVVAVSSCSEEKPPPVVEQPKPSLPPNKVIPVLPPAPKPEAEPPESIAEFPDEPTVVDVSSDGRLMELLLADPGEAEKQLAQLESPNAWRVALLAQFAVTRGKKTRDVDAEEALPLVEQADAGVVTVGPAWVADEQVPLMSAGKKPKQLERLAVNTPLEIKSLDGATATVSVPIAQVAVYGATGHQPERLVSKSLEGTVLISALTATALDVNELMARAREQKDDDAGKLKSVALWQRAWRIERSARTRDGLLRAGWAAERASTVVLAALARDFAPVSDLRFAYGCNADAPPSSKWVDVAKGAPKVMPKQACVSGVDARTICPGERPAKKKGAEAMKTWLEKEGVAPKSWLRFTVDARDRRQVFLVATPVQAVEGCDEFEQVTVEARSGVVRRLSLPLGVKTLEVWVPVEHHLGIDYSIPSATAEGEAVTWLRSREK